LTAQHGSLMPVSMEHQIEMIAAERVGGQTRDIALAAIHTPFGVEIAVDEIGEGTAGVAEAAEFAGPGAGRRVLEAGEEHGGVGAVGDAADGEFGHAVAIEV